MKRLTDGSFYNHWIRTGGTLAVASSVDSLYPEHVVYPSDKAMAHKPEHSENTSKESYYTFRRSRSKLSILGAAKIDSSSCFASQHWGISKFKARQFNFLKYKITNSSLTNEKNKFINNKRQNSQYTVTYITETITKPVSCHLPLGHIVLLLTVVPLSICR